MAMQNCFWRRMRYEKAIGLKLMPIPFQLLQAFLLSQLVLLATDGEVRKVRVLRWNPAGTAGLLPWDKYGTENEI